MKTELAIQRSDWARRNKRKDECTRSVRLFYSPGYNLTKHQRQWDQFQLRVDQRLDCDPEPMANLRQRCKDLTMLSSQLKTVLKDFENVCWLLLNFYYHPLQYHKQGSRRSLWQRRILLSCMAGNLERILSLQWWYNEVLATHLHLTVSPKQSPRFISVEIIESSQSTYHSRAPSHDSSGWGESVISVNFVELNYLSVFSVVSSKVYRFR